MTPNDKDKLPGAACKTFMPRETRMAAPVSFIRWLAAALCMKHERGNLLDTLPGDTCALLHRQGVIGWLQLNARAPADLTRMNHRFQVERFGITRQLRA